MTEKLIFLDDNEELREVISDLIESYLNVKCLSVKSFEDLKANARKALSCHFAILDIELGFGEPTGIDAFHWLQTHGFSGEVFFLTGHGRNHPLAVQAEKYGAKIWEKPVSARQIIQTVSHSLGSDLRSEMA